MIRWCPGRADAVPVPAADTRAAASTAASIAGRSGPAAGRDRPRARLRTPAPNTVPRVKNPFMEYRLLGWAGRPPPGAAAAG